MVFDGARGEGLPHPRIKYGASSNLPPLAGEGTTVAPSALDSPAPVSGTGHALRGQALPSQEWRGGGWGGWGWLVAEVPRPWIPASAGMEVGGVRVSLR